MTRHDDQIPGLESRLRKHYRQLPKVEAHVEQWLTNAQDRHLDRRRPHRLSPLVRTASALVALGGLVGVVLHWVPRADALAWAATRHTPILNHLAESFDLPGLSALVGSQKVSPLDVTARHNGITVQVMGAYADSAQTLVFLRTTQGSLLSLPQQITLRDQFGNSLFPNTAAWNSQSHQGYVDFSALPSWVWTPGVRLTLTIQDLGTMTNPAKNVYAGPWQLRWIQAPPRASRTISVHSQTHAHGVTFSLNRILLAPSAAVLHLSSSTPLNITPAIAKEAKGRKPQFTITRIGTGKTIPLLSASGGGTRTTLMSNPLSPGQYVLEVSWWNQENGPWELPFTVPR